MQCSKCFEELVFPVPEQGYWQIPAKNTKDEIVALIGTFCGKCRGGIKNEMICVDGVGLSCVGCQKVRMMDTAGSVSIKYHPWKIDFECSECHKNKFRQTEREMIKS